jgi:hypothetical protein
MKYNLKWSFIILDQGAFCNVDQKTYAEWYGENGIFYCCPNIDLGYCNNVFGGYCGRINKKIEHWRPFFLTYSCFNMNCEAFSKTQYFENFSELSKEYHHLLTLDWAEFDPMLSPGPFEAELELWDLF